MTHVPPIVRRRLCAQDGCDVVFNTPHDGPWPQAFCSAECHRQAKQPTPRAQRKQLRRAATKQRRRPVAAASVAQAAKRAAGASIVSGATTGLDAAHVCPRALGGCDHPDCVVPLTRVEHRAFDAGELDLLPYLVPGHVTELQHALAHYRGDVIALLERVTGERWTPVGRAAA